jgi:hypothetical protein
MRFRRLFQGAAKTSGAHPPFRRHAVEPYPMAAEYPSPRTGRAHMLSSPRPFHATAQVYLPSSPPSLSRRIRRNPFRRPSSDLPTIPWLPRRPPPSSSRVNRRCHFRRQRPPLRRLLYPPPSLWSRRHPSRRPPRASVKASRRRRRASNIGPGAPACRCRHRGPARLRLAQHRISPTCPGVCSTTRARARWALQAGGATCALPGSSRGDR